MPDLGTYATEVLLAYAVSLGLLALLITWTWARSRRVRRDLAALEARVTRV
ncbi:heme exporter protein CcmD [Pararhodobacter zhoushanensis]|uniref:Heme exporter protein D n=1 Tax=Pararhodobacter zhoushanensis TaxID=2479545 RepID=A0ABT3GXZ6_9RHOB|nr:heme exporter protein CcmD [Pararhodobacter zhoushanensis]MCW1932423.1 heme exporter protein CcmD [Pararhodobacter zhoushanensis]